MPGELLSVHFMISMHVFSLKLLPTVLGIMEVIEVELLTQRIGRVEVMVHDTLSALVHARPLSLFSLYLIPIPLFP